MSKPPTKYPKTNTDYNELPTYPQRVRASAASIASITNLLEHITWFLSFFLTLHTITVPFLTHLLRSLPFAISKMD